MTEYDAYLRSEKWETLRNAVMARARGVCELCEADYPVEVHHLTYDRFGNEKWSDLVALCAKCHKALHDENAAMGLGCLAGGDMPMCYCPVCSYRRHATREKLKLRTELAKGVNELLHRRVLPDGEKPMRTRYASLRRDLSFGRVGRQFLCKYTGEPAGRNGKCSCDTCVSLRVMEHGVREFYDRADGEGEDV